MVKRVSPGTLGLSKKFNKDQKRVLKKEIKRLRSEGNTWEDAAAWLNANGFLTANGLKFTPMNLASIAERIGANSKKRRRARAAAAVVADVATTKADTTDEIQLLELILASNVGQAKKLQLARAVLRWGLN